MDIKREDIIIDPACGTGGFLVEAMMEMARKCPGMAPGELSRWAQPHILASTGCDRREAHEGRHADRQATTRRTAFEVIPFVRISGRPIFRIWLTAGSATGASAS
jgi:23S rRNA G2445 N2-methylase RlmL